MEVEEVESKHEWIETSQWFLIDVNRSGYKNSLAEV